MEAKEIANIVNRAWMKAYNSNPTSRKYMGGKIPHIALTQFLRDNSYGHAENDKKYVIRTLECAGVNSDIAAKYYDMFIFGNYPQTA